MGDSKFNEVSNPGQWSEFTFQPYFSKKTYAGHTLATGCKTIPTNANGNHLHGEWVFFTKVGKQMPTMTFFELVPHQLICIPLYDVGA